MTLAVTLHLCGLASSYVKPGCQEGQPTLLGVSGHEHFLAFGFWRKQTVGTGWVAEISTEGVRRSYICRMCRPKERGGGETLVGGGM